MGSSEKIGTGTSSSPDLADIVISCWLEMQSLKDFMIMKMKLKRLLRPFGLVHLLDSVTDTYELFDTVFLNDYTNVTELQKFELLQEAIKVTGKHEMVDKVSKAYKQTQCLSATNSLNSRPSQCPQLVDKSKL